MIPLISCLLITKEEQANPLQYTDLFEVSHLIIIDKVMLKNIKPHKFKGANMQCIYNTLCLL